MKRQNYGFAKLRGLNRNKSAVLPDGEIPTLSAWEMENGVYLPSGAIVKGNGRQKINSTEIFDGCPPAAKFTGIGLNDMTVEARDTTKPAATTIFNLQIQIDGTGTPDTFKWRKDSGSWTAGVVITGSTQAIDTVNGASIKFAATTGHTLNDLWDFNVGSDEVMGAYWARFSGSNKMLLASSTEIKSATFSGSTWSFSDIGGTMHLACPPKRKYSWAMLQDTLVFSDFAGSGLWKWSGTGNITSLNISGTGLSTLKAKYLATVGDFMLFANVTENSTDKSSTIWWSGEGLVEGFTTTSWATVGPDDGDIITGIIGLEQIVLVFKRYSVWIGNYQGQDLGFVFERVVAGRGCVVPFSLVVDGNEIYFIGSDGIYRYEGNPVPTRVSEPDLLNYYPLGLDEEEAYRIYGFVPARRDEVWFCGDNYYNPNKPTLIYHTKQKEWTHSSLRYNVLVNTAKTGALTIGQIPTGVTIGQLTGTVGNLYFSNLGHIMLGGSGNDAYELIPITDDNGTELKFRYVSNSDNLGLHNIIKRFLGVYITITGPSQGTLDLGIIVDGKELLTTSVDIPVLAVNEVGEIQVDFNLVGDKISFRIENQDAGVYPRLNGISIDYVPLHRRK